eukprot:gene13256-9099_t
MQPFALRRTCAAVSGPSLSRLTLCVSRSGFHLPGWKTKVSTKDARTRQQREADRKIRQIEKLPPVEALHDFQYPYEKTVLSDYMFQYPLYENELDTPHLFNITPPPNFFLYWNVRDFERTAYPEVPEEDHRLLTPSSSCGTWREHRRRTMRYLEKHQIIPHFLPHTRFDVNMSVVFPGRYETRARLDSKTGKRPLPPPPETSLHRRNFWFTAHCGNYIELTELQTAPSVFLRPSAESPGLYTLLIVSPDYPYRIPAFEDRSAARGFFVHYMIANLSPAEAAGPSSGDVVIPYVPPLPTEDAGTTRHICLLYRQERPIPLSATPPIDMWEREAFPLALRSNFRLHDPSRRQLVDGPLKNIAAVEQSISPDPRAITFFQTKWDIQVQEYYESIGHPEPAAPVDDVTEALLEFHAGKSEDFRVRSRHRPDGSTNIGDDPQFWSQMERTHVGDGSMQPLWSRRTAMGSNGVPVTYPR